MTKTKNKTSGKITEAYKSLRYVTLRYVTLRYVTLRYLP